MPKHDKTGRSKNEGRYVRLFDFMARTPAWRGLSGIAVKAWLDINLSAYNGSNNGKLAVPSRALGERIGVHHSAAARAIRELENAGFLRCIKASSFSKKRLAAEYRLTHLKCDITGDLPSKEFMRALPAIHVASSPAAVGRSLCP
jgi:hypothetical protein